MPPQSKTQIPCDCGTLWRAANEPDIPIQFDSALNEFHVILKQKHRRSPIDFLRALLGYRDADHMIIYHCPFCGGAAPQSKRSSLFTHISHAEAERLLGLTRNLSSLNDVLATLGPPNEDHANLPVVFSPERDGTPPQVTAHRLVIYTQLSDVADLLVTVYSDGHLGFGLRGKYVGKRGA